MIDTSKIESKFVKFVVAMVRSVQCLQVIFTSLRISTELIGFFEVFDFCQTLSQSLTSFTVSVDQTVMHICVTELYRSYFGTKAASRPPVCIRESDSSRVFHSTPKLLATHGNFFAMPSSHFDI